MRSELTRAIKEIIKLECLVDVLPNTKNNIKISDRKIHLLLERMTMKETKWTAVFLEKTETQPAA